MSDSAPSLPESSTRGGPLWLALSLLAHGAVLAWLIFLVPAVEIATLEKGNDAQSAPAVHVSEARVREVARQIEMTQAEEIRAKVEELLATQRDMAQLQAQTQTEFAGLAQEMAQAAPQKAEAALATAVEAQARAAQAQAEALEAVKSLNGTSAGQEPADKAVRDAQVAAETKRVADAQTRAREAQTEATTAQLDAAQQMNFQEGLEEVKTAQTRAAEAQAEANERQDAATAARNALTGLQRQAERTAESLARLEKSVAQGAQRMADKEKSIANMEEKERQHREKLEEAKTAGKDKEAARAQKGLDPISQRLAKERKELQKMQEKQQAETAKIEPAAAEAEKVAKELAEAPAKLEAAQSAALQAQQAARTAQATVQSAVAKAFASTPVQAAAVEETPPPVDAPELSGLSLAELYATAVTTEKNIAEQFQSIRAAQVAVQKQIPLSEARKYVQMALPMRALPPPDTASAKTAEDLAAQNEAIEKALKELESMLALTRGMAWQSRTTSAGGEGVTVSMESMKAQALQEQELAALAAENEGQVAVDLSAIMKEMSGGGEHAGGKGGQAGGRHGPGQGVGGGIQGGAGAGQGGGHPVIPSGRPGSGAVANAIPGRKIHSAGFSEGDKWMYVDSWWVIGPFPNPQRRNIEMRFPPESVVDLDASFPIEGGVVRWRFIQNTQPKTRPPQERSYSIYYAYTELWFDEERDLWMAAGSDDYSKIWINDLLVWSSGMQHKSWKPDEGYRKVHFKKGLNRILMRVENGQSVCAFSFMVHTQSNP
jgi:hypothetical protein